ncbi:MAG: hypothetical protein R3C56_37130, partial [Pirellulaceae bacterium]
MLALKTKLAARRLDFIGSIALTEVGERWGPFSRRAARMTPSFRLVSTSGRAKAGMNPRTPKNTGVSILSPTAKPHPAKAS